MSGRGRKCGLHAMGGNVGLLKAEHGLRSEQTPLYRIVSSLLLALARPTPPRMNLLSLLPLFLPLLSLPLPTHASKLIPSSPSSLSSTAPYGGRDATILQYPADWAREILPKPIHCHNCYWQDAFVYTALAYGARSIESDVSAGSAAIHRRDGACMLCGD